MERLAAEVKRLRNSKTGRLIRGRIEEFIDLHDQDNECWFSELCFCILTANCSAESGIKIQKAIGREFSWLPRHVLQRKLRRFGYRFPNRRAQFIVEARKYNDIKTVILQLLEKNNQEKDVKGLREWLVKNIKGLGYKEVSHYLRNVGYLSVAILDRHILRILHEYGLIGDMPRTLTKRKYLEIESIVNRLAERVDLPIGELDLYLWYMRTGKILK